MTKEQFDMWGSYYYHAFDHTVMLDYRSGYDFVEIIRWCVENIGENGKDWQWTYNSPHEDIAAVFGFLRAQDATLFTLRWS
jgi:hypothetical protein